MVVVVTGVRRARRLLVERAVEIGGERGGGQEVAGYDGRRGGRDERVALADRRRVGIAGGRVLHLGLDDGRAVVVVGGRVGVVVLVALLHHLHLFEEHVEAELAAGCRLEI